MVKSNTTSKKRLAIEAGLTVAIALVLIFIAPMFLSDFRLGLLGRFLALAIVALGVDLIWGYTGLLSLGQGSFFSLGGYALAMHLLLASAGEGLPEFFSLYGVSELPWFWHPFYSAPLTLIGIVLIPGIVAGLLGYLVFRNRIRGVYFSILTQAMLVVFFNFFNGQQKLINGTNGLATDTTTLFGQQVGGDRIQFVFYGLTVICLALIYALCRWLTSGRFGRLLVAIRDDENRLRFSGYDPAKFKVVVFAVAGAIAGIAGALYSVQSGGITPQSLSVPFSIEMVIWVAVGGRATLGGAVLGALLVNWAQALLSERFPEVWLFFQGALFLLVVTALPNGIVGWLRDDAADQLRSLFVAPRPVVTYPSLELDPDVQQERKELVDKS